MTSKKAPAPRPDSSFILHPSSFRPASSFRRGYSFAEVLFAVAVLGIGFIMVAAIFPAAILQTQAAIDETVGTTVSRNGAATISHSQLMNKAGTLMLPFSNAAAPPSPAGRVYSFHDPRITPPTTSDALWNSVRNDLISSDDPRFAIVPMYSRGAGSTFAKIIVVSVRVRRQDQFQATIDNQRQPPAGNYVANLEPRPVKVRLIDGGANATDYIQIRNLEAGDDPALEPYSKDSDGAGAAVTDAFVIISDDRVGDDPATLFENENGRLNGRVYRLGAESNNPPAGPAPPGGWVQYELAVGGDMSSAGENLPGTTPLSADAIAFIVGRGYADPLNPGNGHDGPAQAVQAFQRIVPLR